MTGATPALKILRRTGVAFSVHRYHHDPGVESYGSEAAEALGIDPARVFKTLMVNDTAVPRRLAAAVIPVSTMLSLKSLARVMKSKKVTLAAVSVAERSTGYVVGGISPLGQKRSVQTFVDASALEWSSIFISGGQRGLDVELSPTDLLALTCGITAELSE